MPLDWFDTDPGDLHRFRRQLHLVRVLVPVPVFRVMAVVILSGRFGIAVAVTGMRVAAACGGGGGRVVVIMFVFVTVRIGRFRARRSGSVIVLVVLRRLTAHGCGRGGGHEQEGEDDPRVTCHGCSVASAVG